MDRERPKTGDIYTHFKGKDYQIICIATDTETEEELVVYKALYGEERVFARPITMFLSRVDREKYPQASQLYRFEKKQNAWQESGNSVSEGEGSLLLNFLDLEDSQEKLKFLQKNKTRLDGEFFSAAAESLEYVESGNTLEERYQNLLKFLKTKMRYEGRRPR